MDVKLAATATSKIVCEPARDRDVPWGMEKSVPTTFPSPVAEATTDTVRNYRSHGWTVAGTANGISLITDDRISAIELTGALAATVRRYLRANDLSGPVIEIPGAERREIHLAVGAAKAAMAISALRGLGAIVHTDGSTIPLPPTRLSAGSVCWGVSPSEARWVPPVVAIAAAVRAAETGRKSPAHGMAC